MYDFSFEEDLRVTKVFILVGAMATELETMAHGFNDITWHTKDCKNPPRSESKVFICRNVYHRTGRVRSLNQHFPKNIGSLKIKKIA